MNRPIYSTIRPNETASAIWPHAYACGSTKRGMWRRCRVCEVGVVFCPEGWGVSWGNGGPTVSHRSNPRGGHNGATWRTYCAELIEFWVGPEMGPSANDIMALIRRAPWREAVTYRDSWPHEYVVIKKDGQEDLLASFCERIARGEGVECQFFGQKRKYLFLGEHKYWIMTECSEIDLEAADEVLNRALLYRDRRDFVIKPGDTGTR